MVGLAPRVALDFHGVSGTAMRLSCGAAIVQVITFAGSKTRIDVGGSDTTRRPRTIPDRSY